MITKKNNPCKDCADRRVGCHGGCDKYKVWKVAYDEWSAKVFDARTKSRAVDRYVIDRALKAKQEHWRKSH